MPRLPVPLLSTALLLLAATLFGCEEDIAHPPPYDKPFTLYGVLSPQLPRQSILVYPVETGPTLGSADPIDAAVTSMDLTTGETYTWRDSARVNAKGLYTHAFWAPFRAEYGHRYRIEVTRPSDDASSSAEVQIPPQAEVRVDQSQSPRIFVTIRGYPIRVFKPEIKYSVRYTGPYDFDTLSTVFLQYAISYEGRQEQRADGWEIKVNMEIDRPWLHGWYALDYQRLFHQKLEVGLGCPQLELLDAHVRFVVGDTVWNPPGGTFDPTILSHPEAMDNVENGFGFIGSGYRIDQSLHLTPSAIQKACFWSP